jgi:hypothetical protein
MARAACRFWDFPPRGPCSATAAGFRPIPGIMLRPLRPPRPFDQKVKPLRQAIFPRSGSRHAVLRGKCGAKCPIGLQSACMLKRDNK